MISGNSQVPRILIVEDEQVVAMDVEMQLISFGYEVAGIAASSREALQLVATTKPDLILMDIQLRGPKDGIVTASEIQRTSELPVIFVTAFGNEGVKRRAREAVQCGFLTKPYRPEDLRAVLIQVLAQNRQV